MLWRPGFLGDELGQANLIETLRRIADASHRAALAQHQQHDEAPKLRETIDDCDAKIARYRATLDAGGDPTLMAGWISETAAIKKAAQARLGFTEAPPERMSEERIAAIVEALGGLLGLLRQADEHDRAEVYARIGLQMQYRPGTGTVLAEIRSKEVGRVAVMCPEIDTDRQPTWCQPFHDYCSALTIAEAVRGWFTQAASELLAQFQRRSYVSLDGGRRYVSATCRISLAKLARLGSRRAHASASPLMVSAGVAGGGGACPIR